jgi:hypothetical protein
MEAQSVQENLRWAILRQPKSAVREERQNRADNEIEEQIEHTDQSNKTSQRLTCVSLNTSRA